MNVQQDDELFVQNIEVLADSLQQFLDILRLAERDQIIIHFIDDQLSNKTIQTGSLLQGATFFSKLQSIFLSHSSTFSLQAARDQGKAIGRRSEERRVGKERGDERAGEDGDTR